MFRVISLKKNILNNFTQPKGVLNQKAIQKFYTDACNILKFSPNQIELLKVPHSIIKIHVPLTRDDGTYSTVVSYRCHHKHHELPLKGGLTISPKINQEMIESAAMMESIQLAFLKIPFGGSKGGLKINLSNFSEGEIERLIKRMAIELTKYNFIGSKIDIVAPEQGSTTLHMDYIKDIYQTVYGHKDINSSAIATGKGDLNDGLRNHSQATGAAIYYSIKCIVQNRIFEKARQRLDIDSDLNNQRVIMNGFGKMGKNAALFLYEKGVKIIGIQESDGCVFNRNGIDINDFSNHYDKYKCMLDYKDYIEDQEIFNRECDFLVLAAYSDLITSENVDQVNTKVIVEASYQGISYAADQYLNKKGILVIPDLIGNSGRSISSYIEWLKNIQHQSIGRLTMRWEQKSKMFMLKAVQQKLQMKGITVDFDKINPYNLRGGSQTDLVKSTVAGIVEEALIESKQYARRHNCSLRIASMVIGIERIQQRLQNQGYMGQEISNKIQFK